jgi:predicted SnoaL-like aldol condensation-catalyzing enzyme
MPVSSLEANKALVLAHYDAVTNRHDPDAIRTQVTSDFFDHAANAAMTADDVIAHSAALHATFGEMNAAVESIIAEGDTLRPAWSGAACTRDPGAASRPPENASNFAA